MTASLLLMLECRDTLEAVKAKHLCFCCFGRDHFAKLCGITCSLCKGRHHELLCKKGSGEPPKGTVSGGVAEHGPPYGLSAISGK